jgi:drug/metabolite transporter (DMT)-like permease
MDDISKYLVIVLLLYVATGVLQPVILEVLNYHGTCEHSTMLFILPTYLGMSMTYFFSESSDKPVLYSTRITKNNIQIVSLLCALDILSQTLNLTGLVFTGSLLFTILYSSCTIWTAIFSYIILNRSLHFVQWISVFVIVFGLAIASFGSVMDHKTTTDVIFGGILILSGSIFHSLTYILSEKIMVQNVDRIPPENLSYIMGFVGTCIYLIWQIVYTLPNFHELVVVQIIIHNGRVYVIIVSFIMLILVNFIHAFCFFNLLGSIGATTTGVLKGVQTVIVFILSHFAFCSLQRSQCFTIDKGASLVIVVIGIIGYSCFYQNISDTSNSKADGGRLILESSYPLSPMNGIKTRFPYTPIQDTQA